MYDDPDAADGPDLYWRVWPNPRRQGPRWSDWWRVALVVVLLIAAVPAAVFLPTRIGCRDGLPSAALWSQDGACVGVSDGGYDFGHPEFARVLTLIDQQNKKVRDGGVGCQGRTPVTVGALLALASPGAGGRTMHELEGLAAAQAWSNEAGCTHTVLVTVANMGGEAQAAQDVARMLRDSPDVVAVVGMGLSSPQSAAAADVLGRPTGDPASPDAASDAPVPMVADVITAAGFDSRGSAGREPDFAPCAATYPDGIGHGYFRSIAYSNAAQIQSLKDHLDRTTGQAGYPNLILTPDDTRDPYTCTSLALAKRYFGDQIRTIQFKPNEPSAVLATVDEICDQNGGVATVFYAARSSDLGRFIQDINSAYRTSCNLEQITLLSPSDANRLLVQEPTSESDHELEDIRQAALAVLKGQNGKIRLVFSNLTGVYAGTEEDRTKRLHPDGVDPTVVVPADFTDGWTVNSFDALRAVVTAAQEVASDSTVTRGAINVKLQSLEMNELGGKVGFDRYGSRVGTPPVLQICPATATEPARAVPDATTPCPR